MVDTKKLILKPKDWECTLAQCPPGHFMFGEEVGLKTAYKGDDGFSEVFCSNGDAFWGGKKNKSDVNKLKVIPAEWVNHAN